jgi:pimeloyl-ACP methyl ester carboxylesterase
MRKPKKPLIAAAAALAAGALALSVSTASGSSAATASHATTVKPTIVLVHGAWADGSSWSAVTTRLQAAGYTVDVEANPLRGVASDALYLHDLLVTISGPIVLVGHSYGGMVITGATSGLTNVKALVYVDAYIPQDGDSLVALTGAKPGSTLDPSSSVVQVPLHDASGQVVNADIYVKPAQFPSIFAGGIAAMEAAVLAAGQRPLAGSALTEAFAGVPAWQSIPSWDLIGTADMLLPPVEQQIMAQRAGSHIVKVNAPHLSMVAKPWAVTSIIEAAANHS